jgi:polysaccharide biosynthesis/export protein
MLRFVTICAVLLAAFGRAATAEDAGREVQPKNSTGAAGDYVLQPQDLLRIKVFKHDDLNLEIRISQEATVTMHLIGTVDLRGKTARQAEELIRKLYDADYLVNPQVNVTVLEYAPRSVEVVGAVNTPGVVYFPKEEGMSLLGAINRAGSFNRLANRKKVTLKRKFPDGMRTEEIDMDALIRTESAETWPVQPGDVIYVPEKII